MILYPLFYGLNEQIPREVEILIEGLQQKMFRKMQSDILLSGTHKMTYFYDVPQNVGTFP
jgi:hypothetical protein